MRLLTANDIEDEDDDENEHDRRIEEGRDAGRRWMLCSVCFGRLPAAAATQQIDRGTQLKQRVI